MKKFLVLTVLMGVMANACIAYGQAYSDLWGKAGEKWQPDGRLPDFSYAGYRCGTSEIPTVPEVTSVKSFGARGDGQHDDTQAFLDAIAQTSEGAIFVPPGRYKITKIIDISKSHLVLRGAGANKSILFFPKPLNDIKPNWGSTTGGQRTSNYSWSGGLIRIRGSFRAAKLAEVTADAKRGSRTLEVSSTQGLTVGQRVEIVLQDDKQKTLTHYLYSGDPGDSQSFREQRARLL